MDAKSTVQPKGVPSSSFLAYFLPMDADESSTREAMPILRILRARWSAVVHCSSLDTTIEAGNKCMPATEGEEIG